MTISLTINRIGRLFILIVTLTICFCLQSCSRAADRSVGAPSLIGQDSEPVEDERAGGTASTTFRDDDLLSVVLDFEDRSPVVREAAIRRLLPYPRRAAAATIDVFVHGNLSSRLCALELLRDWKAPIEEFDPWQPESLTPERLQALEHWLNEIATSMSDVTPQTLQEPTQQQRIEAEEDIARMISASDAEAEAIRERLARWGQTLIPSVYERLKTTTTDRGRLRLQTLRYRLVCGDDLARHWPDGLLRLAAPDNAVRQKAVEELVDRAGPSDQLLLRELFSDPNPLIREICLRGMRKIGGKSQTLLLDLLADPDANVRAAVLKQLEENPVTGTSLTETSLRIGEYVGSEKDADLVGHAVRVLKTLRAQDDAVATRSLMGLLKHESWQVRAETAAALGENSERFSQFDNRVLNAKERLQVDVYVALIELLNDNDNFVVSKAVEALKGVDMTAAVEPLLKAIEKHPELAEQIIKILNRGNQMQAKAVPQLQALVRHSEPMIRAAIFTNLVSLDEKEIAAGIDDPDSGVRIAAMKALFRGFDRTRENAQRVVRHAVVQGSTFSDVRPASSNPIASFVRFFSSGSKTRSPVVVEGASTLPTVPVTPPPVLEAVPLPADGLIRLDSVVVEVIDENSDENLLVVKKNAEEQAVEKPTEQNEMRTTVEIDQGSEVDLAVQHEISQAASMVDSETNDRWLQGFYRGEGRPDWAKDLVGKVEKMLDADSPEERIAAATLLVPLGKPDEMLPLLIKETRERPEYFELLVSALNWVVREKRWEIFRFWRTQNFPQDDQVARFLNRLAVPPDLRNELPFWEILSEKEIGFDLVDGVFNALKPLYLYDKFSYNRENLPAKKIQTILFDKLIERAGGGSENQRLVAMALLTTLDNDKANDLAARLDADSTLSDEFRLDMLRIRLLTQTNKKELTEIAMAVLKQNDPARSSLALRGMIGEGYTFRILRNRMYLSVSTHRSYSSDKGSATIPPGLELDSIKPLIGDANDEVAAYAGYFASLLGDSSGMQRLLNYWRENRSNPSIDSEQIGVMVYRAVAAVDDSRYIPELREIYSKLDEHEIDDFYWTIRRMTGPKILEFRKEIRTKHGTKNLM